MFWIMILLCGVIIVLLIRLSTLKKGLKNITSQLEQYSRLSTRKKIDLSLSCKEMEDLAESINDYISLSNRLQNEQKTMQEELRKQFANISHDLRTPLTSIRGYVQILKRGEIEREKREWYLERIDTRSKDLYELVENFFTLSVIESPEYALTLETLNVKKLIIEIVTSFYDQFEERGIYPIFEIENNEYLVIGDKAAINRVILNLVGNLLKHVSGEVTLRLEHQEEMVQFTMINDAGALTQENKDKIFERFYTGDDSRSSSNGNTGLGLTIAKTLMLNMGGTLECEIVEDKLWVICNWRRGRK
ncbi:MAG: HAMP domain-containing sensor histidine kinase [bacterium]|nr:HAMP domain-containing sensor histidine kinase [bacterium]